MAIVPLPEEVDLKSGSAAFVNPLTVVGFLEVFSPFFHSFSSSSLL